MKWDEFFDQLTKALKTPETLEDAMEYIQKDPACQVTIEDLAFKQVIINILVAAGIISEKDFNDSVAHFKNLLTKNFAEKLLANVNKIKDRLNSSIDNLDNIDFADEDTEDNEDWDGELPPGKKFYDA